MGCTATHTTSLGKSSTLSNSPAANTAVDTAVPALTAKSSCQHTFLAKQQAIGILFCNFCICNPDFSLATQQAQKEDAITKKGGVSRDHKALLKFIKNVFLLIFFS